MKRSESKQEGAAASQLISKRIAELDDWRGCRKEGCGRQAQGTLIS
jgi:hypothetical protein